MIVHFDYEKTAQHAREMVACAEMVKTETCWHVETLDSYARLDEFYKGYFSGVVGSEFARATKAMNDGPPLRVLDMGAGRGETSLYLANHGHQVFPVEPSLDFCEVIEHVGARFGIELTMYNCSAEHLDIAGEQFDVVIFNASLHHCDDPLAALKNAHRLLRPGGKVMVLNEVFLRFYKTHAKWQQELESEPDEFGHYGGNEHSYYYSEYVSMIRQAGFTNVNSEVVARLRSREVIAQALASDPHRSKLRKLAKSWYSHFICFLVWARLKPVVWAIQQTSIVQSSFVGSR
jgi:ubiquinone/menaquinone biosynthesis C-methylase UbiE